MYFIPYCFEVHGKALLPGFWPSFFTQLGIKIDPGEIGTLFMVGRIFAQTRIENMSLLFLPVLFLSYLGPVLIPT
jgi:hypothetical protein